MMEQVPKSVKSRLLGQLPLYHISFNGALEGLWTPGEQAGFDVPGEAEDSSWAYPEAPMTAISVGPTVEDCFRGVFPNVAHFFEKDKLPHINFYVYSPMFVGVERVVLPKTLTEDGWVWDAHVTHEYRILDPVHMKVVGEIQVMNTNSSPLLKTNPYNNLHNPRESVGPASIRCKWV
jgi:hypothetical protein